MMTTTLHQGHVPGRARLVASGVGTMASWHGHSVAPAFTHDTTRVAAFPTNAYAADHTTEPCAKGLIERIARHLGPRST